jgi:hypothetical protein
LFQDLTLPDGCAREVRPLKRQDGQRQRRNFSDQHTFLDKRC